MTSPSPFRSMEPGKRVAKDRELKGRSTGITARHSDDKVGTVMPLESGGVVEEKKRNSAGNSQEGKWGGG